MYDLNDSRRKRGKTKRVDLFINGPEPIIDAFLRFRDEEGHTSHWSALEDLLRRAGVAGEHDTRPGASLSTRDYRQLIKLVAFRRNVAAALDQIDDE